MGDIDVEALAQTQQISEGYVLDTEATCNLRIKQTEIQFSSESHAGSVTGSSTSGDQSVEALTQSQDIGEGNVLNTKATCNLSETKQTEIQFSSDYDTGSVIGPSIIGDRDGRCLTQLITKDGKFNAVGTGGFINEIKQAEVGFSCDTVSIIGPQVSGKSTLLNHLFGTNFKEMEAAKGRSATTEGAWIAKSACTPHIVMDLEGADGSQNPEDDAAFEKRLALLALVVSDVVLINMWSSDIFAEENATKSLLRTLLPVSMKLSDSPKLTTLIFVIRDHDEQENPLNEMKQKIKEDVKKIWRSSIKPKIGEETTNTSVKVKVVALPTYRYHREQFLTKVGNLRKQLFSPDTTSPGLTSNRSATDRVSSFMERSKLKWEAINLRDDEATSRCKAIADEKLQFVESRVREFQSEVTSNMEGSVNLPASILDMGKRIRSLLDASLAEYDLEVPFFYEPVRTKKRKKLESTMFKTVRPFFENLLGYMSRATLEDFETSLKKRLKNSKGSPATSYCIDDYLRQFDERSRELASVLCESPDTDTDYGSNLRRVLKSDIEKRVDDANRTYNEYAAKLDKFTKSCKEKLSTELSEYVEALLDRADKNSWSEIRKLLDEKARKLVNTLRENVDGLDEHTQNAKRIEFKKYGESEVERMIKEEAQLGTRVILIRMKNRFLQSLFQSSKKIVEDMGRAAYSEGLEFLDFMDSIRLEDTADNIEIASNNAIVISSRLTVRDEATKLVPSSRKVINPGDNSILRRRFKQYAENTIREKKTRKDADKAKSNWKIPHLGHF